MINSKKHQSIVISSHVINTINSLPEEEKVAVATAFVSEMIMGVDPENALSPLQAMLYGIIKSYVERDSMKFNQDYIVV